MTNTNPEAIRSLVTDVHAAVRRINGVQAGTPLANVQAAFEDHVGPDWRRDLAQTLPAMAHTYQCVEMGWWLLHELAPGTPCNPPSLADDENTGPALPVRGDVVVVDGDGRWRIGSRRDHENAGNPRWIATPLDGGPDREITLQEITGYEDAGADSLRAVVAGAGVRVEGPDGQRWFLSEFDLGGARALVNTGQAEPHHVAAVRAWDAQHPEPEAPDDAVARILNAAMNWENALRAESQPSGGLQAIERRLTAEDILRCEISAYMPLVAK